MKHVRIYLQVAIVTVLGAAIALASDAGAEQTLAITDGSKVTLEYTLALPDRTVVESNVGKEPISYTQGNSEVLPGLEKALAGLKAGDKKHVTLSADEAYGSYDEKKKVTVTKEQVPPEAKVVAIDGNAVVVDTNHPLAGKSLVFDINVLKVESPSSVPLQ